VSRPWDAIDRVSAAWIALAVGLIALGLGCYQLAQPHVLTGVVGGAANEGYDDGVYVGAAIRLVHGVLPYRDFVFVQPPGISYLLTPFALVGLAAGSHVTLILGRFLTVLVAAANPVLAGWLVRPAGRAAVAVASLLLAVWPLTVAADAQVLLEPYLVFFVLLGAVVLFGRGDDPSRRRLIVAGVLLGFACVIKVWGVLPAAAAVIVWMPRWHKAGRWLTAGIVAGAVIPCLPFLLVAPHAFIHEVFADQLSGHGVQGSTPLGQRLLLISGLRGVSAFSTSISAVTAVFVVVALAVVLAFGIGRSRRTRLDWFVLLAAVVVFIGSVAGPVMYNHGSYVPAAMLALLIAVLVGARPVIDARWPVVSMALVGVGAAVLLVGQSASYAESYLSEGTSAGLLATYVPVGACVLTDLPSELIAADRFTPSADGCPAVVDPFGMYLAENGTLPQSGPPFAEAFTNQWFTYLEQADYVVLTAPFSDYIPWVSYMESWFNQNYVLLTHDIASPPGASGRPFYVYRHVR
jgi:alpha-1,2-mannosyltransferase